MRALWKNFSGSSFGTYRSLIEFAYLISTLKKKVIHIKPAILILIAGFFMHFSAYSQQFDFNQNCRNAYNEIIALRLKKGQLLLDEEQRLRPNNRIIVYLENYIDFIELFTSESKSRYALLSQHADERINLLATGNKQSPYYLFTQAEVYIQWSVIKLKFGDYVAAILDIRKANKLLLENQSKFPDFKPNTKSLGTLQCLFGSIPDNYKWGGSLLGLSGSIEEGSKMLNGLISYSHNNDFIYKNETVTIYAFILFHLNNKPKEAWKLLINEGFPIQNNLMSVYTIGYIGTYGGNSEQALKYLVNAPKSSEFIGMSQINYLIALCKLYSLDPSADKAFNTFLAENKSKNYIKSAYQKLGWYQLLFASTDAYKTYMAKVLANGEAVIDADKQAEKEASQHEIPDLFLLKARLLCDGGYYSKALQLMQQKTADDYPNLKKSLEYEYRLARIYDLSDDDSKALVYYQNVIERGTNAPYYYAANSALNTAYIYEERKNVVMARQYFTICLSMKDHEYVNSLSQKAKAGLNRLAK